MNLFKNLKFNIDKNQTKIYLFIFILGFISRSVIAYFYGDRLLENEWSILVSNLYNNGVLSMLNFDGLLVPNLWMPPVYAYFIYIHSLIVGFEENFVNLVILSQIILSSLTVLIFYRILLKFYSIKVSLCGAIIFCLFPLIVYSASQISSATIYLFLLLSFIYLILNLAEQNFKIKFKNIILIGILAGILILTRRDFILIYFLTLLYSFIFFKISLKKIFYIVIITVITISPYITRNYIAFDKFIIHSGFGYNLWKAYSVNAKVEGYYIESDELKEKVSSVKKDIHYRINEDKIYLNEAKYFILQNPKKTLDLFIKRFFSFFFIDLNSSQKNYYNLFHILPNLLIALLSFFGLILWNKKNVKLNYLILTMAALLIVYSLFALLPRYKIYILPFQIILTLNFLNFLIKKLSKKN